MPRNAASAMKKPLPQTPRPKAVVAPPYEALTLEHVMPELVEPANAFYRRRTPATMMLAGEAATLAATWPPTTDSADVTVIVRLGGARGTLKIPKPLLDRWLRQADPDVSLAALQPAHAALLLEALFDDDLARLEQALDCPIEIETVGAEAGGSPAVGFTLSVGGDSFACGLDLEAGPPLARLGTLFELNAAKDKAMAGTIPLPINLLLGAVRIAAGEIASLQPGDVVLLDDSDGEAATGLMTIGSRLVAAVEQTPQGSRLTMRPLPLAGSQWEWIMNDRTPPPDNGQPLGDSDLDGVPVVLAFELGRATLPLGEIRQLAPGAIVPLADVRKETVDMIANGKRIGQGEIVRIGDSLGVRVVRVFDNAG